MGFKNHELFIRQQRDRFQGPILEIGSRDYGSTVNLRQLFPDEDYIGIDMQAGKGVDRVLDLTLPFEAVDAALEGRRFGAVICLSVLEHCAQPFHRFPFPGNSTATHRTTGDSPMKASGSCFPTSCSTFRPAAPAPMWLAICAPWTRTCAVSD